MNYYNCEITSSKALDETGALIDVYGLKIITEQGAVCYESLCTRYDKIEKLYNLLKEHQPEDKIVSELLEDYIFD